MEIKVESPKAIMSYFFKGIMFIISSKVLSAIIAIGIYEGSGGYYESSLYGGSIFFLAVSYILTFIGGIFLAMGGYEGIKLILVAQEKIIKVNENLNITVDYSKYYGNSNLNTEKNKKNENQNINTGNNESTNITREESGDNENNNINIEDNKDVEDKKNKF